MQPSSSSPLADRIRAAGAALEVAPGHIVALLVLASCACAGLVALWWTARPQPAVQPAVVAAATHPAAPVRSSATSAVVVVHVSGAVVSAGVYELATGARVVDAIDAAGGPRARARTEQLNLARVVQDGEQIHVPDARERRSAAAANGSATGSSPAGATGPSTGQISLNTASTAELETLPGVGPVLAARIIQQREHTGGFTAVEDLLQVDGIGEKTFAQLRELVTR